MVEVWSWSWDGVSAGVGHQIVYRFCYAKAWQLGTPAGSRAVTNAFSAMTIRFLPLQSSPFHYSRRTSTRGIIWKTVPRSFMADMLGLSNFNLGALGSWPQWEGCLKGSEQAFRSWPDGGIRTMPLPARTRRLLCR